MANNTPLYPLKFEPIYKEKVWGGRTLETLGRVLPGGADTGIGESWELADLTQTSVSGGGGGAERSMISDGPLAGKTLHDVIRDNAKAIMGDLPVTGDGNFPLLVKFLDAQENLSVQVHPSTAYAAKHADAHLKSECWYVLAARSGAAIYKGVQLGVTPQQFRRAIDDQTVQDLLVKIEVQPGQMHYLPSGTCHALGAGCFVAEVQTPSDTTFRVYDWGRTDRQLHVDPAMQCIEFGPPDVGRYEKDTTIEGDEATTTHLVTCEHFSVDRVEVETGFEADVDDRQPVIWTVLQGTGSFYCIDGPDVSFGPGQTILMPPGMRGGRVRIYEKAVWLKTGFPQAEPKRMA